MIDWTRSSSKITQHFTVKEACWLPSWGVLHKPNAKERDGLIRMCELLEKVRAAVKAPITVHCMLRPSKVNAPGTKAHGKDYNYHVKGAANSAHISGLACDFHVSGTDCDDLRKFLLPMLESWGARMEDAPGTNWCHIDLKEVPPGGNRFFKP